MRHGRHCDAGFAARAERGQGVSEESKSKPARNGLGSLYQRGKAGVWWVKYYVRRPDELFAKPVRESTKTTDRRAAERFLKARIADVEAGRPVGAEIKRLDFEALADLITDDYARNERRSARDLPNMLKHLRA